MELNNDCPRDQTVTRPVSTRANAARWFAGWNLGPVYSFSFARSATAAAQRGKEVTVPEFPTEPRTQWRDAERILRSSLERSKRDHPTRRKGPMGWSAYSAPDSLRIKRSAAIRSVRGSVTRLQPQTEPLPSVRHYAPASGYSAVEMLYFGSKRIHFPAPEG